MRYRDFLRASVRGSAVAAVTFCGLGIILGRRCLGLLQDSVGLFGGTWLRQHPSQSTMVARKLSSRRTYLLENTATAIAGSR